MKFSKGPLTGQATVTFEQAEAEELAALLGRVTCSEGYTNDWAYKAWDALRDAGLGNRDVKAVKASDGGFPPVVKIVRPKPLPTEPGTVFKGKVKRPYFPEFEGDIFVVKTERGIRYVTSESIDGVTSHDPAGPSKITAL